MKPYTGGNEALSVLHALDVADKHKLLIPVAAFYNKLALKLDVRQIGANNHPPARWLSGPPLEGKFPLKDGDEIFSYARAPDDMQDKSEFDFGFDVAFGEGQIVDGKPLIPTLTQLIDFTERLIDIFVRRILKTAW
jgi:hypothetical protein